jgi:hypothetical protein
MDSTVPRFLERHFPERIPPTERKSEPPEMCRVLQEQAEGESVSVS